MKCAMGFGYGQVDGRADKAEFMEKLVFREELNDIDLASVGDVGNGSITGYDFESAIEDLYAIDSWVVQYH
jgi:hypothetical protein